MPLRHVYWWLCSLAKSKRSAQLWSCSPRAKASQMQLTMGSFGLMNTINYKASVLTELEKTRECVVFKRRKKKSISRLFLAALCCSRLMFSNKNSNLQLIYTISKSTKVNEHKPKTTRLTTCNTRWQMFSKMFFVCLVSFLISFRSEHFTGQDMRVWNIHSLFAAIHNCRVLLRKSQIIKRH